MMNVFNVYADLEIPGGYGKVVDGTDKQEGYRCNQSVYRREHSASVTTWEWQEKIAETRDWGILFKCKIFSMSHDYHF